MENKNQKRALSFSVLSIVLCVAMLIGTTFAWFTDNASTGVNLIQAGTLDVELQKSEDSGKTWTAVEENESLAFQKAADGAGEEILWEPGVTYNLPLLRVVNKGNLALKYKIHISGLDGNAELLDAIDFTLKNGEETVDLMDYEGHIAGMQESGSPTVDEKMSSLTISGHMRENAGNEYQGLTLNGIYITVVATQDTVEHDSNNNNYDQHADYENIVYVSKSSELQEAINTAESGDIISLTQDVNMSEETFELSKAVTLDLGGKTLTGTVNVTGSDMAMIRNGTIVSNKSASANSAVYVKANAFATLESVNIEANSDSNAYAVAVYGNCFIKNSTVKSNTYGFACYGSSKVTVENTNVVAGGHAISTAAAFSNSDMMIAIKGGEYRSTGNSWDSCAVYWAGHGTLKVEGGTFVGGDTGAGIYQKNGTVHISGGSFSAKDGAKLGAESKDSTEISFNVTGGTFTGTRAGLYYKTTANGSNCKQFDITITGGTFVGEGEYKTAPRVELDQSVIKPGVKITGSNLSEQ